MIGCGIFKRAGWKTLDADPENNPDILATIPPFPEEVFSNKWSEIEWIHGITSLYKWRAREALTHIHEILTPDGKLVLEQPDFEKAKVNSEWVFGDSSLKNPLIMNRSAYTPAELVDMLHTIGFSKITLLPAQHHLPGRDFRVEAYR